MKLKEWKERKREEFDRKFPLPKILAFSGGKGVERDHMHLFLDTYADELVALVRESVPKKMTMEAALESGSDAGAGYTIGFNACRAEINANFDRLCDVKPGV